MTGGPDLASYAARVGARPIGEVAGAPGHDGAYLEAVRASIYRAWLVWVQRVPEDELPVRPIAFGRVSPRERCRLGEKGVVIAEACLGTGTGHCVLGFVDRHADERPEVVHDLLVHLAGRLEEADGEGRTATLRTLSWAVSRLHGIPETIHAEVALHFEPEVEPLRLRG